MQSHLEKQGHLAAYILPTVISMVLVGTYTNIDGLFIGRAAGDAGLSAINIAWPIVAFITAVGTGIGVGGSVVINTLRGERREADGERAKFTTLVWLFAAGIFVTGLCLLTFRPLLRMMGAEGEVRRYAENYAVVIAAGALCQIVGAGIVVLLRNDGQTVRSMVYTFGGLLIHVLLDFLLVGRYALYGVAISTVLSQLAVMIGGLISLEVQPGRLFRSVRILCTATAPFGVNFVSSLTLLFTNFFALRAGGTAAVSAYAVMSYAVYTYDYIFQGICDGTQPVLSYTTGGGLREAHRRAVRVGVLSLAGTAAVCMLITPLVRLFLPRLFAVSDRAGGLMARGLIIYAFSYPFKAAVKWMCAYAYSTGQLWISNLLTYADPLAFSPLCLLILPHFWKMDGIWMALPASQMLTALLGGILFLAERRRSPHA